MHTLHARYTGPGAYTGKVKPWVTYSLLRLGLFAAVLALLLLLNVEWWIAAIVAAAIGLCVSYIFFGRLRDAVALDIAKRREAPASDADATVEDA